MTTTPLITSSVCVHCGTTMRRTWTDDLTDYTWRAIDGTITGTVGDVPAGAPTSIPELLELLAARGDMHAYSTVLARYQLGALELPWEHLHRAIELPSTIAPQDVPDCHGWPMRAAPGVWICRIDGTRTPMDPASTGRGAGAEGGQQG